MTYCASARCNPRSGMKVGVDSAVKNVVCLKGFEDGVQIAGFVRPNPRRPPSADRQSDL